jgi:hypothetical protein
MRWLRAKDAAREWCGGTSPKLLYKAVKRGELKAAPIGSGRNLLFCEPWIDEWLRASAERKKSGPKLTSVA